MKDAWVCRIGRESEEAFDAINWNLNISGRYVVMANMYANMRWCEGVVGVRKLMKESGVCAVPAWSFVAVNGVVDKFVANDKSHPKWTDIDMVFNKLKRTSLSYFVFISLCCSTYILCRSRLKQRL